MTQEVDHFIEEILMIDETDYGDFMRKANLHLNELEDRLHPLHNDMIDAKLYEMKQYLQYAPTWEVDPTRDRIFRDAKYIDQLLGVRH